MNQGYLYLMIQITAAVAFGHIIKWSAVRRCNLLVVATINYFFATVLSYLLTIDGQPVSADSLILIPGIVGGISYAVAFLFYYQGIRLLGVSISLTMMRLAVMPAVLASMIYWQEALSLPQQAGIVLALLALPLLTSQAGDKGVRSVGPRWIWLVGLFIAGSGGPLALKAFQESGSAAEKPVLLVTWFAAASICTLIVMCARRTIPQARDYLPGVLLGVLNVLINLALLGALENLPGALVFPATSAGGVLLATVSSAGLWRERLGTAAMAGVGISVVALVLLNAI